MKHPLKITLAIMIASLAGTSHSINAAALPKTAKLLPPETILLVDVDNFSLLKTQFEKTSFYKFYKDPAMAAFVSDAKTKLSKKVQQADNEIARIIVDANVLPQGRAALALVFSSQAQQVDEPTVSFIIQWGENVAKIRDAIDKMTKKALEKGSRQKTEIYRDVTITTITRDLPPREVQDWSRFKPEQNDVPTKKIQPPPENTHYCFVDDCLIGSDDIETLKFIIAHIKGADSPTLADDADYTSAIGATGPHHDVDLYANIRQIIKIIAARDVSGGMRQTITTLGLDNVAAAACSLGIARGAANSFCGKAIVKVNGAKKGICKMLDTESALIRLPPFVPASAYSLAVINLDIKKAYNELYNVLYALDPAAAAELYITLLPPGPQGEPGIQLKNDIIEHLGSQIIIAQSINNPLAGTASLSSTEILFAAAVSNRSALEKSLSLLYDKLIAPNNPQARRELLGYTIYSLNFQTMPFFNPSGATPLQSFAGPAAPAPAQPAKMALTVTDTHLIFGTESTVEQAIRTLSSSAASLNSAEWFTTAKSAVPSAVGVACLQDEAASTEFLWSIIRQGGKNMPAAPSMLLSQTGRDIVDFTLLPPFESVRKYFGLSALCAVSRPDGFFFEFRSIERPENK
jgi:hypothetical protein